MDISNSTIDIDAVWRRLLHAAHNRLEMPLQFKELISEFVAAPNYFKHVQKELTNYNNTAYYQLTPFVVKELSNKDKIALLPELLDRLRYYSAQTNTLQNIIAAIPSEDLIPPLEIALEPYFQNMDELEVREMLMLCIKIDLELARKYAIRTFQNPDRGVMEAGKEMLEWLHTIDEKNEKIADQENKNSNITKLKQ